MKWPTSRGWEILQKCQHDLEWGEDVRSRIEIYRRSRDEGFFGYGACYGVNNIEECVVRLKYAPFFNPPQRSTRYISYARNALDIHAFFGPEGGWGEYRTPNLRKAMLSQRYTRGAHRDARISQYTILKVNPTLLFWQKFVDFCQSASGRNSIPWIVCEVNSFNSSIYRSKNNAFAVQPSDSILDKTTWEGRTSNKRAVKFHIRNHSEP